ncbi:MAG: sugar ABC transporter permease [Propionibacteriaceae bacterium]|jgi:multiple sugar transport system permease protein/alpha-1,4-digalacturonate transport system permease protein|nr:sugar ABC transporter permease [Propionibacteriaceae bacterium]
MKVRSSSSPRQVRRATAQGLSFILPNFVGFAVFTLVPLVIALALAFMSWDAGHDPTFVGLANFQRMVTDLNFRAALVNTLLFALGTVPLTLVVSLGLAALLNSKIPGLRFFRAAMFFPYITSLVAVAAVWNMLFSVNSGPINTFLRTLGMQDPPGWTASPQWALVSLIIVSVWRGMGYYMILFLAGLQSIPTQLYEAAQMDGAGRWKQFLHVTLPGLRPTTFFVMIMLTISSFKIFDLVQVMTEGGPGRSTLVLAYQVYQEGIVKGRFGYASAISMVLFAIVLIVTIVQFRMEEKHVDH